MTVRCVDTATAKKLRPARNESWPSASSELLVSLALDFFEIRSGARDPYRYDEFKAYSPRVEETAFAKGDPCSPHSRRRKQGQSWP